MKNKKDMKNSRIFRCKNVGCKQAAIILCITMLLAPFSLLCQGDSAYVLPRFCVGSDGIVSKIPSGCAFDETLDSVTFKMVYVEEDTFSMGCTSEQIPYCGGDEWPVHVVRFSNGYYIGETEVTQKLWMAVMGKWYRAPSETYGLGDDYPAYYLSFNDIVGVDSSAVGYIENGITYYQNGFCYKLSVLANGGTLGCKHYRLPTEAEWEYAARGGKNRMGYIYSGSNAVNDVGWNLNDGEYSKQAHQVGMKQPNELGLYDMSGNLWEWCSDYVMDYTSDTVTDPLGGDASGVYHILRGGDYSSNPTISHRVSGARVTTTSSTYRDRYMGFRLVVSFSF
jgi:formylglycine-generating enzyme required for sulfatase activity